MENHESAVAGAEAPASLGAARRRTRRPKAPVPAFACDDPLLTAAEAAAYRRQGLSTFWRDVRNGTVPQPVRITPKAPRWRLSWLTVAG